MVKLFPHQRQALEKLRSGSILCGGVGTGKSLTALAYYFEKVCGGKIDGEFRKMTHPLDLYVITTARKRDTQEWGHEFAPFLLDEKDNAYPTIVKVDSWNNIHKYVDVNGAFFIFDEQRVVGYGEWSKSFLKIARKNQWILLTATPGDTWMDYMPVFLANGFYRNPTDFKQQHVIYSRFSKYPKVDRYVSCGKLLRQRNQILVRMEFRKKTVPHWLDIPAKYDRELTRLITRARWNPYKDEPIQDAGGLCYVLRRVANSDSSRFAAVMDILQEHPKAIIFYNFDYELEALRKLKGVTIAEWNGHQHDPLPTGDRWVYLVQYAAGAEGWNCTTTDTLIFYSLSYSYKTMTQAAGRIDRLNTPFTDLYYYRLTSTSPIDLAIRRALKDKRDFNQSDFASHQKNRPYYGKRDNTPT